MQTWSDRPTLDVYDSCFFFHFSAKIYQQVSQKVAAKHCLYWALHLHNFISKPLRETTTVLFLVKRAPAQTQVVHSPSKVGRNKQKNQKKDNLGFVSASGVRREENPQYGGVVIWHTLLSDTLYFLYLRRQSGTFVIVLSGEVSFSSSAFKMTHKQRSIKENKSRDRKTFFVFAMCVVDLGGRLGAEFCRKSVQEPSKVTASP